MTFTFQRKTARRFGSEEDGSRKDAKGAKCGEIEKFNSWRLGAKDFIEIVLLNILSVRIMS